MKTRNSRWQQQLIDFFDSHRIITVYGQRDVKSILLDWKNNLFVKLCIPKYFLFLYFNLKKTLHFFLYYLSLIFVDSIFYRHVPPTSRISSLK